MLSSNQAFESYSQSHYWRDALKKKIRYKRTTLDLFWGLAHMSYFWSLHLPWKIPDWALQIILFYSFKFPSSLSIAAPTPLLASELGLAAIFPSFAFSISFSWSQPVTKHFFFLLASYILSVELMLSIFHNCNLELQVILSNLNNVILTLALTWLGI